MRFHSPIRLRLPFVPRSSSRKLMIRAAHPCGWPGHCRCETRVGAGEVRCATSQPGMPSSKEKKKNAQACRGSNKLCATRCEGGTSETKARQTEIAINEAVV